MPHDYDSDDSYDINDPRTREHAAYKISQENAARAGRRYTYGDDVDADGENYSPDRDDNDDSMEQQLANAREARYWALDEANRRYEWNGQWTGGAHEGVEEEADKRMDDVARWNGRIEELERRIDHARDAEENAVHDTDSDDGSPDEGSEDDDEYEKQVNDARSVRERRYHAASDEDEDEDQAGVESEESYLESDEE